MKSHEKTPPIKSVNPARDLGYRPVPDNPA